MDSLPPLSSADLEALFKEPAFPGGYQDLEETAAWLLDPSPAESNDGVVGSTVPPSVSPTGVAGMPAEYLFGAADPLAVFLDGGATRVMSADPAFPGVPSLPAMPPVPLPAAALAGIRDGSSVELSLPDMLPGAAATDSSGGSGSGGTGSGTASGGSGSMGTPAAAATSPPALRGRAGGKGGRKELTEEQKERIKAKNRRAQVMREGLAVPGA